MNAYSEYLQITFILRIMAEGRVSVKDDFRITLWKILRKLWLDELPMIYNWLKGRFKLVVRRPLTCTIFKFV